MRRATKIVAVAGVFGLAVAAGLASHIPLAAVSVRPATAALSRGAELSAASSLARGRIRLPVFPGAKTPAIVGWKVTGLSVVPFGPRAELSLSGPGRGLAEAVYSIANESLYLRDGRFTAAVPLMVELPGLDLGGHLSVKIATAEWRARDKQLRSVIGDMLWRDAGFRLEDRVALGDIQGKVSTPQEGRIFVEISNSGAEIALSGSVIFDVQNTAANVDVLVKTAPNTSGAVLAILEGWGVAEDDGYRVRRQFDLP